MAIRTMIGEKFQDILKANDNEIDENVNKAINDAIYDSMAKSKDSTKPRKVQITLNITRVDKQYIETEYAVQMTPAPYIKAATKEVKEAVAPGQTSLDLEVVTK